ncbi:MAG: hypothetical protein V2A79_17870 [Planctomycetota bacterium]
MPTLAAVLLAMLDGCDLAGALMPWGKPGPIRLPIDPDERAALVDAHLCGAPADVVYSPAERAPESVRVDALALAALCPATDGGCRWLAIDLDAADGHGAGGLADPLHATRCFAERADAAGLLGGLLTARSRGGRGVHVFVFTPEPVPLADAVLAAAALAAAAFCSADADVRDGAPHAFRQGDGGIARPGQPGAVELVPRSTAKPPQGWGLALPAAGAFTAQGGGIIIDAFDGAPVTPDAPPRCGPAAWRRFIDEARARIPRQVPVGRATGRAKARTPRGGADGRSPMDSPAIRPETRAFLAGQVAPGGRNVAAFAASCNLLGCGVPEGEAKRLVLAGAAVCGLGEREARTAFASAVGSLQRKGGRR